MKIKVKKSTYEDVLKRPKYKHKFPFKQSALIRWVMSLAGNKDLKETHFCYKFKGISDFPDEPCLILMNHSSYIDLEIIGKILRKHPYAFVATSDGFIGKELIMRLMGCIPTNKFVSDMTLVSDISYALKKNKSHVVMYPEASYSFDGTATMLPRKMGVILKRLSVPVLFIKTEGAFTRDPLYNMLQKRYVDVSCTIEMLFSKEDLSSLKVSEIDKKLDDAFTFDNFSWQFENKISVTEDFRADGLERILFRCPSCKKEGCIKGNGIKLTCSCGLNLTLDQYGKLQGDSLEPRFTHIPSWYNWEREEILSEIKAGTYKIDCDCNVLILRDMKAIYDIGKAHLTHDIDGFRLVSKESGLDYTQSSKSSYSLYADYYWYELGDIICIGSNDMLYYCFPEKEGNVPVAKARIATEEIYKLLKKKNINLVEEGKQNV